MFIGLHAPANSLFLLLYGDFFKDMGNKSLRWGDGACDMVLQQGCLPLSGQELTEAPEEGWGLLCHLPILLFLRPFELTFLVAFQISGGSIQHRPTS